MSSTRTPIIFQTYPSLKLKIPWISLGDFPTPVQKLDRLGKRTGVRGFYIKRDDLSSNLYGGNKIRKLEFILADAKQREVDTLITGGGVGSNFSLATAIHGRRLGMRTIMVLMDHPVSEAAKKNMLLDYNNQAKMIIASPKMWRCMTRYQFLINIKPLKAKLPYFIPIGGSNELGSMGFIDAAFELKKQIADGDLPEPDYIFITSGSLGSFCGLWLGSQLSGLKSKIIGINVSSSDTIRAAKMLNNIYRYLRKLVSDLPYLNISGSKLTILQHYRGKGYACFTKQGMEAILLMNSLENIELDGTYTAKTLAGTLDHIKKNHLEDKTILFWNTYNSVDLSPLVQGIDYRRLPTPFHKYFESQHQEFEAYS